MIKVEFLNALKEKLAGLPEKDIEERLSFYEEMIDDRMDEGKTEEEAVADIGSMDDVVYDIAQDVPLTKLVKEKIKPKRSLKAWEIVLLILGFPLWFPLALVGLILCLVAYLLFWILVIVVYTVEGSLVIGSFGGVIIFFAYLFNGTFYLVPLGASLIMGAAAIFLFFGCKAITVGTVKLHKKIFTSIKAKIIKKGAN